MANPLPYLRNTSGTLNAQVLYPFTRSVRFTTTVNKFMNASEQRWPNTPPFYDFLLPMTRLNSTDKGNWLTFFNAVQGRFEENLSITLGATTFGSLTLISDDLTVNNPSSLTFDQTLRLRQVNGYPWTPVSAGTTFPTFSFGAVAEQPFVQISTFLTSVNDNPYGPRYVYPWYGSGLTNFPTGYLRSWKISFGLMNATDIAALEAFFYSVQGMAYSFTFTDPLTGTPLNHVRFDQDSLEIRYLTTTQFSTSIDLLQTNGS